MQSLPRRAQAYVGIVMLAGLVVCLFACLESREHWQDIGFLAALYWVGVASPIVTKLRGLTMATGFPAAVAAILLLGPLAAAIVCVLGGALSLQPVAWYKRLFNVAQEAVSAFVGGMVYIELHGVAGNFGAAQFPQVLIPVVGGALAYFLVNYGLVAVAISLSTRVALSDIWWGGMSEFLAANMGYALLGLVIAVLWSGGVGVMAGLLVLAPMLIARMAFKQYAEQHKAYEATVASLIQAVETKDYYTRGHSERVSRAAVMTGEQIGMRQDRIEMLRYAGMLHDVGKLGVPTKVLQKSGALTDEEFDAIKLHPTRGVEMVHGISFLDEAMRGIRHHHERMDGRGYPDGLRGDEIPEFARVIAVADAFDSMTSTRSYRNARSVEAAVEELRRWSGTQFDPQMVDALIGAVEKNGWEAHTEPAEDVVDPSVLVARDHDDPASDVLVQAIPTPRSEAPVEQVS